LRLGPEIIASSREAAVTNNIEAVRRYAYEAVRFNPHPPLMLWYCATETALAVNTPRERRLRARSTVLLGTLSAMFNSEAFASPNEFRIDREVEYLHFGYGVHRCFGYYINSVQIPELMAALLRLPNLRRASGGDGRILYEGPFPDRLILKFDSEGATADKG
jgi:cytochrome P450